MWNDPGDDFYVILSHPSVNMLSNSSLSTVQIPRLRHTSSTSTYVPDMFYGINSDFLQIGRGSGFPLFRGTGGWLLWSSVWHYYGVIRLFCQWKVWKALYIPEGCCPLIFLLIKFLCTVFVTSCQLPTWVTQLIPRLNESIWYM